MKEQFKIVLENEELDSAAKIEEIARIVGEQTVIKSKFNENSTKLKTAESELDKVNQELEAMKTSNMTDSEKIAKAEKLANEKEIEFTKRINRLDAEKTLMAAGLKEEDYGDLIDNLISEDAESTNKRIVGISELLTKQKEKVENTTKEDLLKKTPRPEDGGKAPDGKMSKEEFRKLGGWERAELYRTDQALFEELAKN